ncbi:hypothetical protein PR001_g3065, partial [Phytophthora rubi]
MTSVRDKVVAVMGLKTPVRITIADGRKIDAVPMGTVGLKLMDGTSVKLSGVLYIPEVEGSLISVAKLAEKDVVAQFSKDKCVFRYGDATSMEAKRCGNVYKLKIVRDEMRQVTCVLGKMREDNFSRNPEKTVKSAGVLDLIHSDVMGPMQTKTPGDFTYAVTFIDDFSRHVTVYFMKKKAEVLEKFKMFKTNTENATDRKIKRIRSENGGEIPNTVTVKTHYGIVYQKKPQLKNLKVFGALGYGHIPDEKRRKLDAKVFKYRFLGYEDSVKRYRVLNVATGQVKIGRTVKFMETTSTGDFMTEIEGDDKDGDEDVAAPHATARSRGQSQTLAIFNDEVVPLQHEVTTETAIVPAPSHSMITRSRTRHIEETTDPEEAEGR